MSEPAGRQAPPRVVLDTNIVLDWLVFEDGGMPRLMAAIKGRLLTVVSNAACVDELTRVLAYPAFKLDETARRDALQCYLGLVEFVPQRASLLGIVPRCRDRDDQKFLELAAHAGAAALVSKDHAVLALKRSMKARFGCELMGAAATEVWVEALTREPAAD
jgi:putative PIN family toxin of toxin-antitoxin system